jgi:excisionase family DNA binding protein
MDNSSARIHANVQASTMSVDEAAEKLGSTPETLLRYIRAGDLPHIRLQGAEAVEYRLLPDDVRDLQARMNGQANLHIDTQRDAQEREAAPPIPARPQSSQEQAWLALQGLVGQLAEPLTVAHKHLADENARLLEIVRTQAEELGRLQAERDSLRSQVASVPEEVHTLKEQITEMQGELNRLHTLDEEMSKLQSLDEEVTRLKTLEEEAAEQAYRKAWREIQHRPWWMKLPDTP